MDEKKSILLLEGIHQSGAAFLKSEGYAVQEKSESLDSQGLLRALKSEKIKGLGIRSKTHVNAKTLQAYPELEALGTFCIGTNQVDLKAASTLGLPVFNAPYSNTRSVAELVLAEVISLSRKICEISMQLHRGEWNKKAKGSYEVRGKSLGIVGYGHIGTQVGILAEAFGMNVFYYDIVTKLPLGNAKAVDSFKELLEVSDFVTLHVPETEQTKNMMAQKELSHMKEGSYLINASRGTVVDHKALKETLISGKIAGAAIDVYPKEPRQNGPGFESELLGMENVILTPHIGGSTEEAQKAIGEEVSLSLHKYFKQGDTLSAVNFPKISPPELEEGKLRLAHIHHNQPGVLGKVNSLISNYGLNISYQSLATLDEIGYLIVDFLENKKATEKLEKDLKNLSSTIRFKFLKLV